MGPGAPSLSLMLLLITVMYVFTEKTLQLNIARLCCHNFYRWWYFNWGGGGGPPLATPMIETTEEYKLFFPAQFIFSVKYIKLPIDLSEIEDKLWSEF